MILGIRELPPLRRQEQPACSTCSQKGKFSLLGGESIHWKSNTKLGTRHNAISYAGKKEQNEQNESILHWLIPFLYIRTFSNTAIQTVGEKAPTRRRWRAVRSRERQRAGILQPPHTNPLPNGRGSEWPLSAPSRQKQAASV